jgi:catechol 2,3-dioxygenase-like lactoylglutathione lyase family enzyme
LQDPRRRGFHHVHLAVPDPEATIGWFQQMIGGERVKDGPGLRFGSVAMLAEKSAALCEGGGAGEGLRTRVMLTARRP